MKKNSVVSLALSVALSLSALSVVCATDRDVVMSAEITPELRQIQNGASLKELEEESEVFKLPDGKYLIVEG